jgi:MFS family permease
MSADTGTVRSGAQIVLLTLAAGQFLMALDSSVMNVSIATVAADVGTTLTGIQGAITAYTLVMAAFMVAGAKVGPLIGGVATTCFSWRWVFAGEVVVVLGILVLARRITDTPVGAAPAPGRRRCGHVGPQPRALRVRGAPRRRVGWVQPKSGAPSWRGLSPTIWLTLT